MNMSPMKRTIIITLAILILMGGFVYLLMRKQAAEKAAGQQISFRKFLGFETTVKNPAKDKGVIGSSSDSNQNTINLNQISADNASKLKANLDSLQDFLNKIKNNLTSATPNIMALNSKISNIQTSLDSMRANLNSANPNLDALRSGLADIKTNLDALRGDLLSTTPNLDAFNASLDAFQTGLDSMSTNLDNIASGLSNANSGWLSQIINNMKNFGSSIWGNNPGTGSNFGPANIDTSNIGNGNINPIIVPIFTGAPINPNTGGGGNPITPVDITTTPITTPTGPGTGNNTTICSTTDSVIEFTADEQAQLLDLRAQFDALAPSLFNSDDVASIQSDYDNFNLGNQKVVELRKYFEAQSPKLTGSYAIKVSTPFYSQSGDNTSFTGATNLDSNFAYNPFYNPAYPTDPNKQTPRDDSLIEKLFQVNIW